MGQQPLKTSVRYGKVDNVVVLIFPDARAADYYITQIGTQSILQKLGANQQPTPARSPILKKTPLFNPRSVV